MELENTDQVLDSVETPEVEEVMQEDEPSAELEPEEVLEAAPEEEPAWEPDFKYKVYDEEKEMDDWARQFIKTPEDLEKFKKFYEAEGGFNVLKERHNELKNQVETHYKDIEKNYNDQSSIVNNILGYLDKKDYRSFFKQMDVADDEILQYALDIVKYREMSPDQRQIVDQQIAVEEQNKKLEWQTNHYQQQIEQQAIQTRELMLNQELSKPDVLSFVNDFEKAYGKPGSFREEVVKEGQLAWATQGVDLTPEQAVQKVVDRYKVFVQSNVSNSQPTPQQTVVQPKPVLPNVQAGGASPAKRQIKSIADIRALAQSME